MTFLPIDFRDSVVKTGDERLIPVFMLGYKDNVQHTTASYVLQPGTPRDYPYPTTNVSVTAASTSASDGAGNVVIGISGLDSDYNIVQEAIPLNGTSPVTLAKQYFRINRVVLLKATTTTNTNVGTITLKRAGSNDILAEIPVGHGSSRHGVFTAPAGYNLKILNFYTHLFNRDGNNSYGGYEPQALVAVRLNSGFPNNHWRKNIYLAADRGRQGGELSLPIFLQEKTTVEIRVEEFSAANPKEFLLAVYVDAVLEKID